MKNRIFLLAVPMFLIGCGGKNPSPTVNYHTITFHSNEGSEVPTLIVEDGKLAVEPKDPSKEAFKFAGWYTEDSLTNYFNFSTKIEKDYDLYARWESEYEYRVTLYSDDKLKLEKSGGFLNQENYISKISLKNEFINKYELPASKDYYRVTVDGRDITTFEVEKESYATDLDYYVNITIPQNELGSVIEITTKPYCHYLTFTGIEDGASISYSKPSVITTDFHFSYSLDEPNWLPWEPNTKINLGVGESIYVKNNFDTLSSHGYYVEFNTGGETGKKIGSEGNVMSLINFSGLTNYCFGHLFNECFSLISAPVFPSLELCEGCYDNAFRDCQLLRTAPILPGKNLKTKCYLSMFSFCGSLKINNTNGYKFLTCLDDDLGDCVDAMFSETGGSYTADPVPGGSYYYTLD